MSSERIRTKELPYGAIARTSLPENPLPSYDITGIKSDMGGPNLLRVLFTPQKDGFLEMSNPETGDVLSIGFASLSGGYRIDPVISEKIGEIALDMAQNDGHITPGIHEMPEFHPAGDKRSKGMRIGVMENGLITIRNIQGDQGHGTKMDLIVEQDSDVILVISNEEIQLEMEFNNRGTRFPCLARRLVELALVLARSEES